jgi:hypothetical protein
MPTIEGLVRTAYRIYLEQPTATQTAYEELPEDERGYYLRFALAFLTVLERQTKPEDIAPSVMFKMFPVEDQLAQGARRIWRGAPDELRTLYQLMVRTLLEVVKEDHEYVA